MKKVLLKEENKKKINAKKIIKISVLVFILIMIVALGTLYEKNKQVRKFFDRYVFMKNISENKLPKIEVNTDHIFAYQNNILTWKDNKLKAYNKHGTEEYTIDIELINPIYKTAGDYICIADKNRNKIYVISKRNIVWQNELDGKISDISINKNGYCAVVLVGTADKSVVQVFNGKGEKLFSKHIAEDFVVGTAISPNNEFLSIAKVNYSGINVKSIVEVISIKDAQKGETVINEYKSDLGELIIKIAYNNKNDLICMYDTKISTICDNQVIDNVVFEEENILFADINNAIIKVVKGKKQLLNSQIEVQIVDKEGPKVYEIEEPKAIYVYGNMIAINFGSEAVFINNNAWLVKEYSSSQEINNIVISNDIAGIIYKDKVEIVSL